MPSVISLYVGERELTILNNNFVLIFQTTQKSKRFIIVENGISEHFVQKQGVKSKFRKNV